MILPDFPEAQPLAGLAGGFLIGLAAAILLLGIGRIAGVSGMFARATGIEGGSPPWIVAMNFILGLVLGPLLFSLFAGPVASTYPSSLPLLAVVGLLVGFGTRLGSGCTSGHGVCGMSRLSKRSLVATATFILAGIAAVAVVNAMGGAW